MEENKKKKTKTIAVVSLFILGVILVLSGYFIYQMTYTDNNGEDIELEDYINLIITYDDGTTVAKKQLLGAHKSEKYKAIIIHTIIFCQRAEIKNPVLKLYFQYIRFFLIKLIFIS